MCLYVSYLFISKDYNITKSIYQPYKSFVQISPYHYWNVAITLFKGIFGVTGCVIFLRRHQLVNFGNTIFISITLYEILYNFYRWAESFEDFTVYIDFTGIIVTGVLFTFLGYFYFKRASFKKVLPHILSGLFLAFLSYYLH